MYATDCEPLEGNADFYGLGIRIGFYLQWITTYLNFLFKLEPVCSLYTTNSIFVFALAVALVVAYVQGSPPIEIHLMLHISLGFFITSLSTLGIRHWFQDPRHIDEFGGRLLEVLQRARSIDLSWNWATVLLAIISSGIIAFPVTILAPLKYPGLSWSGVFWNSSTLAIIAWVNTYFWFSGKGADSIHADQSCNRPPYVFLFSKQPLEGPIVVLCKVGSVLLLLVANLTAAILVALSIQILMCTLIPKLQVSRLARETLNASLNTSQVEEVRGSDMLGAFLSLGTGQRISEHAQKDETFSLIPGWKEAKTWKRLLCIMLHVYFIFFIVWLITDIECTIRWNNITNVDTVNSTGQLIPLAVGCTSAADVIKSLMLALLGKKYPNWKHTTLEVDNKHIIGPPSLRILKKDGIESQDVELSALLRAPDSWPSKPSSLGKEFSISVQEKHSWPSQASNSGGFLFDPRGQP